MKDRKCNPFVAFVLHVALTFHHAIGLNEPNRNHLFPECFPILLVLVVKEEYIAITIAIIENNNDNKGEYSFSIFIRFPINDTFYDLKNKDTKENKEHSAQLKHHYQMKIICTYLLSNLADQKTTLVNKIHMVKKTYDFCRIYLFQNSSLI